MGGSERVEEASTVVKIINGQSWPDSGDQLVLVFE